MFWVVRLSCIFILSFLSSLLFLAAVLIVFDQKALMRGNMQNFSYSLLYKLIYICIMLLPSSIFLDGTIWIGKYHFFKLTMVAYIWTFLDGKESSGYGRASDFVMNHCTDWFFKRLRRRLNLKSIKAVDLPLDRQYIFAVHPHGILPFGGFASLVARDSREYEFSRLFGTALKLRLLAASFCFMVPIYRELLLWAGFIDAGKVSCIRAIQAGFSLAVCPGGASEALHVSPNEDVLLLSGRKGFIRIAIENGLSIVPVFSFNENNEYTCIQPHHNSCLHHPMIDRLRKRIQHMVGWSVPLLTHICPSRCNVTVVYGRPVLFPKIDNPSAEQVEDAMAKYKRALLELYGEYGPQYNEPANKQLVII